MKKIEEKRLKVMSKKQDLKRQIAESEAEIVSLEQKRLRSQSALIENYVVNEKPNENDVNYFKLYSDLIKLERENLQQLKKRLEDLKKNKK